MRILSLILALSAAAPAFAQGTGDSSADGEELAFITSILNELQLKSFVRNKEYCGYIGYNRLGVLTSSRVSEGQEASCSLPNWPYKMVVIASYHTHSTYSPNYDSEFPTVQDMESDEAAGIDGYISTPGGRLWYVDTDDMEVSQLCGMACLPQDPNFRAAPEGSVRQSYSYRGLLKRENY